MHIPGFKSISHQGQRGVLLLFVLTCVFALLASCDGRDSGKSADLSYRVDDTSKGADDGSSASAEYSKIEYDTIVPVPSLQELESHIESVTVAIKQIGDVIQETQSEIELLIGGAKAKVSSATTFDDCVESAIEQSGVLRSGIAQSTADGVKSMAALHRDFESRGIIRSETIDSLESSVLEIETRGASLRTDGQILAKRTRGEGSCIILDNSPTESVFTRHGFDGGVAVGLKVGHVTRSLGGLFAMEIPVVRLVDKIKWNKWSLMKAELRKLKQLAMFEGQERLVKDAAGPLLQFVSFVGDRLQQAARARLDTFAAQAEVLEGSLKRLRNCSDWSQMESLVEASTVGNMILVDSLENLRRDADNANTVWAKMQTRVAEVRAAIANACSIVPNLNLDLSQFDQLVGYGWATGWREGKALVPPENADILRQRFQRAFMEEVDRLRKGEPKSDLVLSGEVVAMETLGNHVYVLSLDASTRMLSVSSPTAKTRKLQLSSATMSGDESGFRGESELGARFDLFAVSDVLVASSSRLSTVWVIDPDELREVCRERCVEFNVHSGKEAIALYTVKSGHLGLGERVGSVTILKRDGSILHSKDRGLLGWATEGGQVLLAYADGPVIGRVSSVLKFDLDAGKEIKQSARDVKALLDNGAVLIQGNRVLWALDHVSGQIGLLNGSGTFDRRFSAIVRKGKVSQSGKPLIRIGSTDFVPGMSEYLSGVASSLSMHGDYLIINCIPTTEKDGQLVAIREKQVRVILNTRSNRLVGIDSTATNLRLIGVLGVKDVVGLVYSNDQDNTWLHVLDSGRSDDEPIRMQLEYDGESIRNGFIWLDGIHAVISADGLSGAIVDLKAARVIEKGNLKKIEIATEESASRSLLQKRTANLVAEKGKITVIDAAKFSVPGARPDEPFKELVTVRLNGRVFHWVMGNEQFDLEAMKFRPVSKVRRIGRELWCFHRTLWKVTIE